MRAKVPDWAFRTAAPEDREEARRCRREDRLEVGWPADRRALRAWARQQGWPTPWFSFEERFLNRALADDESFARALAGSGLRLRLPRRRHALSPDVLRELDQLYDERSANGRPPYWEILVEELRQIRRAIEAGVEIEAEGEALPDVRTFLEWAHRRYHALEDGVDPWIGNDD